MRLYLDSSALLKRYLEEKGTTTIDQLFEACWIGRHTVIYSVWNIGECIAALDKRRSRGDLTAEEFRTSLHKFVAETHALLDVGRLVITPITGEVLGKTWPLVLAEHLYPADALQISTCLNERCHGFISADTRLVATARKAGLKAFNIESTAESETLAELMTANTLSFER